MTQAHIDIYSYIEERTNLTRNEVKTKLLITCYTASPKLGTKGPYCPPNPSLQEQRKFCDELIETFFKDNKKPLNS